MLTNQPGGADTSVTSTSRQGQKVLMGSGASKAQRGTRKYPSPSNIPHHLASESPQTKNPSLPPSPFPHPVNVRTTAGDDAPTKTRPLGGLDPRLAARLQELGPVIVPRYEPKIPSKVCSTT